MKKKLLIVEFSIHFRIISHLYRMFSKKYEPEIIIKKNSEKIENVPENKKNTMKNENLLYWRVLLNSYKYKYIYLSTGPEFREYNKNIFFLLGFFFLVLFNRNKVTLQIRNLDQYYKKNNICYLIRHYGMKLCKRIVLDSLQIKNNFHEYFKTNQLTTYVSFYYPDLLEFNKKQKKYKNKIVLGLIGIDSNRKDYNLLLDVFKNLNSNNFILLIVGNCITEEQINIIKDFQKVIQVKYEEKILNDKKFIEKALECDIFLSPLKKELGYGLTKETGNFGDAIMYGKKIIIPQFSCISGEFDEISFYYKNSDELLNILRNIKNQKLNLNINKKFLKDYYSINILEKLEKELKL